MRIGRRPAVRHVIVVKEMTLTQIRRAGRLLAAAQLEETPAEG